MSLWANTHITKVMLRCNTYSVAAQKQAYPAVDSSGPSHPGLASSPVSARLRGKFLQVLEIK
jgi:hypothetical protein